MCFANTSDMIRKQKQNDPDIKMTKEEIDNYIKKYLKWSKIIGIIIILSSIYLSINVLMKGKAEISLAVIGVVCLFFSIIVLLPNKTKNNTFLKK